MATFNRNGPALSAAAFMLFAFAAMLQPGSATAPPPIAGDLSIADIPENADLRSSSWESFIMVPPAKALSEKPLVLENASGLWKRQAIKSGGHAYLVFAGARKGGFPLYSQGTWIIKRSIPSGTFLQAKVFLKSDPGTFLRLYPDGDRSRMDLVIYGGVYRRELPLPFSFENLLKARLGDLVSATKDSVDWSLFAPEPGDYRSITSLIASIRDRLPGLRYLDDGGLDRSGGLVYLADGRLQLPGPSGLNCSGFAQWVIDGLSKPLTGSWLDDRALVEKHLDLRRSSASASFEDSLDPYFGLDWTRNLALAIERARFPSRPHGILDADVTEAPFALVARSVDPVNGGPEYEGFSPYTEDAGFETSGLPAMLYRLAIEDPGWFYLASLSKQDPKGLRHHYHIAVILPWFDEGGSFRVNVFESDAETSLTALVGRTKGEYVHLVRVKAETAFDPPILPKAGR